MIARRSKKSDMMSLFLQRRLILLKSLIKARLLN